METIDRIIAEELKALAERRAKQQQQKEDEQ